jgi:hypothetical protein
MVHSVGDRKISCFLREAKLFGLLVHFSVECLESGPLVLLADDANHLCPRVNRQLQCSGNIFS